MVQLLQWQLQKNLLKPITINYNFIMKKNVGTIDKVVRILVALVVLVLYLTNVISGTLGIILLAVGAVLLITALINFCPIWLALGISTGKKK
jgi:hypothetical protein